MGSKWRTDPRYGQQLTQHLELVHQKRAHSRQDPPPDKVKPIPIQLVRWACAHLPKTNKGRAQVTALITGFFYLFRPGEYVKSSSAPADAHPIRLQDTTFATPTGFVNGYAASPAALDTATGLTLNFPNQKCAHSRNEHKDHGVSHGDTTDPVLSPLKAVRAQVLHLKQHGAPPDTPLYTYYERNQPHFVTAQDLTSILKTACAAIGGPLGLHPKDISVRALRNGGCVALLRANVDPLTARLMGRWHSWAMIEYLQAQTLETTGFAQRMLDAGSYIIPRHQFLPQDVLDLTHKHPYPAD